MKKAFKVIAYLLIILISTLTLSKLFIRRSDTLPSNDVLKLEGFFAEPKDSLDVLVIGASTTYMAINPSILWREYGIPAYAFSNSGMRVQLAQLYVKEAIARQHPDVIVLDINGTRHDGDYVREGHAYTMLNEFPLSWNKLRTIFTYTPSDEWWGHVLPLIKYHSSYSVDFDNLDPIKQDPYLGYSPYFGNYNKEVDLLVHADVTESSEITENAERALREIIQVCKDEGVQLVFYTPAIALSKQQRQRLNYVIGIAEEEGIPCLDLCTREWQETVDFHSSTDQSNYTNHANWRGAEKITRALGDFLVENTGVTDRRGEETYAHWDDKTKPYYHEKAVYLAGEALKGIKQLDEYMAALPGVQAEGLCTVVMVMDEGSKFMTEAADASLMSMGAVEPLKDQFRAGYLLVLVDGECVYSGISAENALVFDSAALSREDVNVQACSAGYDVINGTENEEDIEYNTVILDGEKITAKRGINVFVYDYVNGEIVDQARFDTYTTTERSAK